VIRLGVTGSIGMGKSATAARLAVHCDPVIDADALVHRLYAGPAAPAIEAAFPGAASDGRVDRAALGKAVLGDPEALKRLEAIVHPMVREAEDAVVAKAAGTGARIVVFDSPLLFETGRDGEMDAVLVVTAPETVQRERLFARPGMTREKLAALLTRQMPDAEKVARAHFVIDTSLGRRHAARRVAAIRRALLSTG